MSDFTLGIIWGGAIALISTFTSQMMMLWIHSRQALLITKGDLEKMMTAAREQHERLLELAKILDIDVRADLGKQSEMKQGS
jgi:hypothetical protein